jgi:hypothetical protein
MRKDHEIFLMGIIELIGYSPILLYNPYEEKISLEEASKYYQVATNIVVQDNILSWTALGATEDNALFSLPYGGQCILTTQYGIIPNGSSIVSTDGMYDPWRVADTRMEEEDYSIDSIV